ncbi:LOW QUALITY PROTEIN: site-specific recombinase XerD [Sphaerochaeta pleomorpha str. Grapes]|uniref:Site-specific recombinase XerD n=1 Tax=Sphaerochaeta pleomorpha (strain ATCC BAA-1885 / DSM 22778 / Grapes) TaxID=158190 RepID=G8QWV2_SPHPG|nr:LOW QUALITY PROTEIN: site-specific recombinase XerD [Sphaerochaeta pleomorpha str. Grapes]
MAKTKKADLWRLVTDYFDVYLKDVRRMSKGTIETYRYGLYSFVSYMSKHRNVEASLLSLDHFTRDNVKEFIAHLHLVDELADSTCNLRLSILKSFLRYCADEYVPLYATYQSIRTMPKAREEQKPVEYLSEKALKVLLLAPDPNTRLGRRDCMIMIFMYDTGCRVQELVDVQFGSLHLEASPCYVVLTGKGNKTRLIPLMEKTVAHLNAYIHMFHPTRIKRPLFYARKRNGPSKLSTDAIAVLLKKHGEEASKTCIEVLSGIHPHLMRSTRAMHLYLNGMPLENVAKFLGHADSSSISHYATANLAMITAAVEKANPNVVGTSKDWEDPQILKRLMGL